MKIPSTRALRFSIALGPLLALAASPVFAQAPMRFGVDAPSVPRARSLGLPAHFGSVWAGAWNQKWGWGGVEHELQQAFAAGVTPVVHWWYWGDDISPACVESGCVDRFHGVQKDKATWTRLSTELAALILRAGGPGAQAMVVLETEFNKNGIETYEPFDGYLVDHMAIFQNAGLKVVLGFGGWGMAHWDTFDRAVAAADMLGTTALRSSVRDAGTYHLVADDLAASARYLHTRFNKPIVAELAVSSYPAPEYEVHQATVITEIFRRIDELKTSGVIGIIWRMLADDPAFDVNNYHGVAERHWGVVRADGSTKPAFVPLHNGWQAQAALTTNPLMGLDRPTNNASVPTSFTLSGYAIDRGAPSGTGVDVVVAYAVPTAGGATVFLGAATTFGARSDVGTTHGARFTNSGYSITANGLPIGQYTLVVYAKSTLTGTYNSSAAATVTVVSATPTTNPLMSLDSPVNNATLTPDFTLSGYAIDRGAPGGTGVDIVVAYAVPASGGATVFLGVATTFSARSDVGGTWGSRFINSGYSIAASGLAAGQYTIVVYAKSTLTGTYNNAATATVTVSTGGQAASSPLMSVDTPGQNAQVGQPFQIAGWAMDRGASSGVGVDAVVVWAVPAGGGAATFVGGASLGGSRSDVAAFFGLGQQFNNSGYALSASGLAAGTWDLVVYARSTVTGTYNQSKVVRVTIH